MTIRANNAARGNRVLAQLLLIIKINSRGSLRSRKGNRDRRRRERDDSSRSAIHKRLLIPNRDGAAALCDEGQGRGRDNFEWLL